jgi:hypothetical protein
MRFAYTPHKVSGTSLEYIQATVPTELRDEILKRISSNKDPQNHRLAGHIKDEFDAGLFDWEPWHEFILDLVKEYNSHFSEYSDTMSYILGGAKMTLADPWVNYMRKGEYNPIHKHTGIFSYVCWVKVPYCSDEEAKVFPDVTPCKNGCFTFVTASDFGVKDHALPIDKSYEWEIVLFPAMQCHTVYPFYTSEEPRISIAGNVELDLSVDRIMPS